MWVSAGDVVRYIYDMIFYDTINRVCILLFEYLFLHFVVTVLKEMAEYISPIMCYVFICFFS